KGRRISFLHLSEVAPEMRPGARVSRGQLVGLSGNTGRSTAPHLHYQILSKSGGVLDPLKEHPTYRKSLPKSELAAFQAAVERLDRRLRLAAAARLGGQEEGPRRLTSRDRNRRAGDAGRVHRGGDLRADRRRTPRIP